MEPKFADGAYNDMKDLSVRCWMKGMDERPNRCVLECGWSPVIMRYSR